MLKHIATLIIPQSVSMRENQDVNVHLKTKICKMSTTSTSAD